MIGLIGFHPSTIRWCLMHVLHLGILYRVNGGSMQFGCSNIVQFYRLFVFCQYIDRWCTVRARSICSGICFCKVGCGAIRWKIHGVSCCTGPFCTSSLGVLREKSLAASQRSRRNLPLSCRVLQKGPGLRICKLSLASTFE